MSVGSHPKISGRLWLLRVGCVSSAPLAADSRPTVRASCLDVDALRLQYLEIGRYLAVTLVPQRLKRNRDRRSMRISE
jgi:hypothetical protein